jgi:pilus assembly protein Flp/PilA
VPIALPGCAGKVEARKTLRGDQYTMKTLILSSLNRLHNDEAGQGLVEYLLILALVAFAATAGMTSLASGLNSAFSKIGVVLGTYIK